MEPQDLFEVVNTTKYPLEAFLFVRRGLDHTVSQHYGELDEAMIEQLAEDDDIPTRHVSGEQLCLGLREYALEQYGLLARTVLKRWNIHRSEDFGHIVFAMVDGGLMHKNDEDTIDDFSNVFDFQHAFAMDLLLQNHNTSSKEVPSQA